MAQSSSVKCSSIGMASLLVFFPPVDVSGGTLLELAGASSVASPSVSSAVARRRWGPPHFAALFPLDQVRHVALLAWVWVFPCVDVKSLSRSLSLLLLMGNERGTNPPLSRSSTPARDVKWRSQQLNTEFAFRLVQPPPHYARGEERLWGSFWWELFLLF